METGALVLVVGQLAGAILASLVAWKGMRAFRQVRAPALARFAAGFAFLALSQVAAAALEAAAVGARALPSRGPGAFDALFWVHYGALLAGLGALLWSFDRPKLRIVLVAAPTLLVAGPILQAIAVVLLLLVLVHAGLNHIERARAGSLLTTGGFLLLLAGEAAFLFGYAPLTPHHLPGEALVVAGMALLAAAALRKGAR
jgi:hypothetical protein